MIYLKKIPSLQDKASVRVAINLCQETRFKEVSMRLEKGLFHRLGSSWWNFLENQTLAERFPPSCKPKIRAWIKYIGLIYLSYSRRQEVLFGISPSLLVDALTRYHWTDAGRLAEDKLAKRLLRDEHLTSLQKYRIACVYCLHEDIPQLWKRLTHEEKQSIVGTDDPEHSRESHELVLLWSYHMDGHREEKLTGGRHPLWTHAAHLATQYGNQSALMSCWEKMEDHTRQQEIVRMALKSLEMWQRCKQGEVVGLREFVDTLCSDKLPETQSPGAIAKYNLQSYPEVMFFFLSRMDDEQQLTFFKSTVQSADCDEVLNCFLNWPHQVDLLPTINQLWGIISKHQFEKCLLAVLRAYVCYFQTIGYDYESLLWKITDIIPEDYSVLSTERFPLFTLFLDRIFDQVFTCRKTSAVLETLFKRIFSHQPQGERKAMMHYIRRREWRKIKLNLIDKRNRTFLNWLIEECFPKEEIPNFKKLLMESEPAINTCTIELNSHGENFLEDLIDWAFELDTDKIQFRYKLLSCDYCSSECEYLLRKGEFTEVERIINFCVNSEEEKESFKVRFAEFTCRETFRKYLRNISLSNFRCAYFSEIPMWNQMDAILAWGFDKSEEKIRGFKKTLFSECGIDVHFRIIFIFTDLKEAEHFYKWFGLSAEEIKELKRNAILKFAEGTEASSMDGDKLVGCLQWCLDILEEMVIEAEKELRNVRSELEHFSYEDPNKKRKVREILSMFKDILEETDREVGFRKDTGGKRFAATEDDSSSSRKRCKLRKE